MGVRFSVSTSSFSIFWLLLFLLAVLSVSPLLVRAEEPGSRDTLRVALNNEPPHFNPGLHSGTLTGLVGTQLFAGLVRCDRNGVPGPYLAKSWQVSADGKKVEFVLQEEALFHDGRPVLPRDVLFSIQTVRRYHPFSTMLSPIERMEVSGAHGFTIFLSYPYPALFQALTAALTPIMPEHVYGNSEDIRTNPANWQVVGSGPFRLRSYQPGHAIVLERFEEFFIADRPLLREIEFRIFSGPTEIIMALEAGDVQLTGFFPVLAGSRSLIWPEGLVSTTRGFAGIGAMLGIELNVRRKPFDDVRVRRAFSLSIDRAFIAEYILGPTGLAMDGPLVPGHRYYSPPPHPLHQDLEQANRLLDEAGYPRDEHGQRMTVAITALPNARLLTRPLLEYLRYRLSRDIGVDLQLYEPPDLIAWGKRIAQEAYQMSLDITFTWHEPMIGIHRLYESGNVRKGVVWSNITGYRNPRVDELLARAGRASSPRQRGEIYGTFQEILRQDCPMIWLATMPYSTVYDRDLRGLNQGFWGLLAPMDTLYWAEAGAEAGTEAEGSGMQALP
ncbi:ABC transporter substrate-binding protein [Desulfogranum mediterraneum]|uniref:ABC transporter substrate-binding protein n=1 Tax=Desulfogranum mediterraneum TaxID=160661 RepID=UPI000429B4E4|nr:ABC transporter substrate-binding protein [Desulfogranum mediterraneum]